MKSLVLGFLLAVPVLGQTVVSRPNANLYADDFAGAEIGAKINAAFGSVAGTASSPVQGVVVNLNPDMMYNYSTVIIIPNSSVSPYITSPVLDCHGSVLNWALAGSAAMDQLTVLGEGLRKTGEIRNCNFSSSAGAPSTITFHSRIDFAVNHTHFSIPVRFVNDDSAGSPGFTEENHWDDIELTTPRGTPSASVCAVTFINVAGLRGGGSYFYNWFNRVHLELNGYGNGFCTESSSGLQPSLFGSNFDIHVNTGGPNNAVFWLGANTMIFRGVVALSGENTVPGPNQYDVYVNPGAAFYNFGSSYLPGFFHGYAPGVANSNINLISGPQAITNSLAPSGATGTRTLSGEPVGSNPGRLCENEQLGATTAFLLASYFGVENNCIWEIAARSTTDRFPDVDVNSTDGSNPITTRMFASSLGGVGFGAGFTTSSYPQSTVEVRGGLSVRDPSLGSLTLGSMATRLIDATSGDPHLGDAQDFFSGGSPGQPSFHYTQFFNDTYASHTNVKGMDCYARGQVYCSIPNLATGQSSNTDFAGQLTLLGGSASYSFTGLYANAPICTSTDTSSVSATQVSTTTSTLTIHGSGSDVVNYICIGRQ